jgi:hypothetical protein
MNFQCDYPRLFQFFVGYFPDADLDGLSDEEVVTNYVALFSKSEKWRMDLEELKRELASLINNIDSYWQEVGDEANRHFTNSDDALIWLNLIHEHLGNGSAG